MADGWIKIWRKLSDSPMWLEEPFTKGQAWVDLLMLATSSDHMSRYKGKDKQYRAGTVHFSLRFLANRWRWSRNKVYRFIERLKNEQMIDYQGRTGNGTTDGTTDGAINDTTNGTINDTVLIVINWALYQGSKTTNGTTNDTTNDTTKRTRNRTGNGTHPKNDIYPKNDKSKEDIPPKSPKGDNPPSDGTNEVRKDPYTGKWYVRGTDGFKSKSHILLKPDEGTVDDIPDSYRDMFNNFPDYWGHRNQ